MAVTPAHLTMGHMHRWSTILLSITTASVVIIALLMILNPEYFPVWGVFEGYEIVMSIVGILLIITSFVVSFRKGLLEAGFIAALLYTGLFIFLVSITVTVINAFGSPFPYAPAFIALISEFVMLVIASMAAIKSGHPVVTPVRVTEEPVSVLVSNTSPIETHNV